MKPPIVEPSGLSEKTNTLVLSYIGIRRAIGISGLVLPILLGPIGWLAKGRTIIADIAVDLLAYSSQHVLHRKE